MKIILGLAIAQQINSYTANPTEYLPLRNTLRSKIVKFTNCTFDNCTFESLNFAQEYPTDTAFGSEGTEFTNCRVYSIQTDEQSILYEPLLITKYLQEKSLYLSANKQEIVPETLDPDTHLECLNKVLRTFQRNTRMSDSVMRKKLGDQHSFFIEEVLPELTKNNVLVKTPYRGSGGQDLYKLGIPLDGLTKSIHESKNSFKNLLDSFNNSNS